jgi:hypothetical protein
MSGMLALQAILEQLNKLNDGQDKLSASQEELRRGMSIIHEQLKSEIRAFWAGQGKFKGRIIDMLNKPLKGIKTMVKQQAQNLCKEFSSELLVICCKRRQPNHQGLYRGQAMPCDH